MADLTEERVKSLIEEALKKHTDSAFYEGDVHGHKRAHKLQIDDHRAKHKRKEEILNNILKGAAWVMFVFVVSAIWVAIKGELRK